MKRLLVIALLLFLGAFGQGSPETPWSADALEMMPYGVFRYRSECRVGRSATVIVSGKGTTPIGLYVYGPHGQLIAADDDMNGRLDDDRVVHFTPRLSGAYEAEVRN